MPESRAHKLCKEWLATEMDGETEVWLSDAVRGRHRVDVLGWWDGVQAIGEVKCVRRGQRRRCHTEVYDLKSGEQLDRFPCGCAGCS